MSVVLVAIDAPRSGELAAELEWEGVAAISLPSASPAAIVARLHADVVAVVVPARRAVLTPALLTACDRAGVRILTLGGTDGRAVVRLGLTPPMRTEAAGWEIAAALSAEVSSDPSSPVSPSRVTTVWGPHGAPGRSTVAVQLAVELARLGRTTALVDADTVAPALGLLLGIEDDAPGFAAACRRADAGALDRAELSRLSAALTAGGTEIQVLAGINRPSRWPELSDARVRASLSVCRTWADETIVDVSAAIDADDEATYDMVGPRRHAATSAALREADRIVAVAAADPLGISRFLRDHAEVRRLVGQTPVTVVVNQVRPGPLGLDARTQIRRTLHRFADLSDVAFFPLDRRAVDAALLHARPISDIAPRSALVAAVRRLAAGLDPVAPAEATADSSTGSSRGARRLRSALAALAGSRDADGPASAS
ncbi:AAA family ATPase [Zhihengliuella sp. ISTPL4]|uniref:AAA family ATPase n=1 Tax=Zhihengliuella sp. ISTPL4 TaxID=2058657 RepID=UPI0013051C70|nr:P-loop NTPase [Zhihengliuella sp. ISTPL4]